MHRAPHIWDQSMSFLLSTILIINPAAIGSGRLVSESETPRRRPGSPPPPSCLRLIGWFGLARTQDMLGAGHTSEYMANSLRTPQPLPGARERGKTEGAKRQETSREISKDKGSRQPCPPLSGFTRSSAIRTRQRPAPPLFRCVRR